VNELLAIVLAAVLGSVARVIFGYLGEAEPGEPFIWGKALRSIVRGVIGGAVVGAYCYYTKVITDPVGVFLATFFSSISLDLLMKNVSDSLRSKKLK